MKYSRFEQLVLSIGGIAILGAPLLSAGTGIDPYEVAGQLLMFGVLFAAVHWGRRAGLVAAAVASLAYIALRLPLILQAGLVNEVLFVLLARVVAYGLIGIGGGEVCARVQYLLARLREASAVDEWSGAYTQRIGVQRVAAAIGRCQRYGEPFCVITLALSPGLTAELRESRQRALVRSVADYLRDHLRMVDESSRLEDGRFLILLPHATKESGDVVRSRVVEGVCNLTGATSGAVRAQCLAGNEDEAAIEALLAELAPADGAEPHATTGN